MPDTRISALSASTARNSGDRFPVVQTAGVGPVTHTLAQIATFTLGGSGGVSGGNVGIGTTNPASRLDVSAPNYVDPVLTISQSPITTGNKGVINFNDSTGTTGAIYSYGSAFGAGNNYALTFLTNTGSSLTEKMRITSAGNVGIGTTSPVVRLYVADTTSVSTAFDVTAGGVNSRIYDFYYTTNLFRQRLINDAYSSATDAYELGRSGMSVSYHRWLVSTGTEAMRITSAGNVGIGTTSPNVVLQAGDGTGVRIVAADGGSSATQGGAFAIRQGGVYKSIFGTEALVIGSGTSSDFLINSYSDNVKINCPTSKYIAFLGNFSEVMRITSAGNVGIGTSSPSYLLDVSGAGAQAIRIRNTTTNVDAYLLAQNTSGTALFGINANGPYIYTADASAITFSTNTAERMRITSAGNVLIGTILSPTTGTQCLTIETETAPTATPADTVTFYSSDLSAGNTMPSFYTEGTIVGTGTPTANRTIAVRINGTVYYLLASTIP